MARVRVRVRFVPKLQVRRLTELTDDGDDT